MFAEELQFKRVRDITNPTYYISALEGEYGNWAYSEDRAPAFRGSWREKVFAADENFNLKLEIGTGNGFHFAHLAERYPNSGVIGIELKFKPLIQAIRRALRSGGENARIVRYDACLLHHLFANEELNDVYIHFPDPWLKRRWHKNRLIQPEYLELLFRLQRPGSFIEFKTDSAPYFEWAHEIFQKSRYKLTAVTRDLHRSEFAASNFVTHFERIFLSQNLPIHFARLEKI